jgi:single-strand DNA-binding protein
MNETTIHGTVTDHPELRYTERDVLPYLIFPVAVTRRYYNRAAGRWVRQAPVFHTVIAYRRLAENAAQTLEKGMAVTVTGQFADASFTLDGSDQMVHRIRLEAIDIAAGLRWATAEVTRQRRDTSRDSTASADIAASIEAVPY